VSLVPSSVVPIIHAVVLGLTQGLSEFLPISSSGHLILVPWLFGWTELTRDPHLNKTFDVALHLGTLVAVVAYFWRDLVVLVGAGLRSIRDRAIRDDDERLAWMLLLTALPGAAVGAVGESVIEDHLGQPALIGMMLIIFGLVLLTADRVTGTREIGAFAVRDAVLIGVAQVLALQPGVSRSGITMTTTRWRHFDRDSAARIAFLMAVPITGGAVVYKAAKMVLGTGLAANLRMPFLVGVIMSGVSGYLAVAALLRVIRTHSFRPFVAYRVLAGAAVVIIAATSWR
jgi:undecaprenyl-diphosphatase